ncbi:MAG: hypothetical protein PHW96_00460 [Candidatus Nanoarchaeia archaeon]|nr:hypothetical protein [Candidatus Nanoarchaeia archaeon]
MIPDTNSYKIKPEKSIKVRNEPLVGIILNAYELIMTPEEREGQEKKNAILLDILSRQSSEVYHRHTTI